jgi:hypothetical protein
MKRTLIFIFSCLWGLSPAQEKPTDTVVKKTERYGIRLGADVFRLTRAAYDPNYNGFELVADYRFTRRIWLAAELGNEQKRTDEEQLDFTTRGSFLKVGFDYNGYENWLDMENIISIGLRYGVSTFSHTLNSYDIYNPNPYFGEAPAVQSNTEYNGYNASWVEVVAGIKVEVLNNIFVGFSARLNHLLTNKEPSNFSNLYIPGFNRTYEGAFGVGFNYTVTYFIPIYKKAKPKAEKK